MTLIMTDTILSISQRVNVYEGLFAKYLGSSLGGCGQCQAIPHAVGSEEYLTYPSIEDFPGAQPYNLETWLDKRVASFYERMNKSAKERYWDDGKPGNKTTIDYTMFSFRTSAQCGATRFTFEELYWMELYGEDVWSSLPKWEEADYLYQNTINQSPWPGYEAWTTYDAVRTNPTLFDAKLKKDNYGGAKGEQPTEQQGQDQQSSSSKLKDFYRVIIS
jgi:hypothetical protein